MLSIFSVFVSVALVYLAAVLMVPWLDFINIIIHLNPLTLFQRYFDWCDAIREELARKLEL